MNKTDACIGQDKFIQTDADAIMGYLFDNKGSRPLAIMDALQMPQDRLTNALQHLESRGMVTTLNHSEVTYWAEYIAICKSLEHGVSLKGFIDYLLSNATRLDPKSKKKGLTDVDYIRCGESRSDRANIVARFCDKQWKGYLSTMPDIPDNFASLSCYVTSLFESIGIIDRSGNYAIISCRELAMIGHVAKVIESSCGMSFSPRDDDEVYIFSPYSKLSFEQIVQEILFFRYKLMNEAEFHFEREYPGDVVTQNAYARVLDMVTEGAFRGPTVRQDSYETICGLSDDELEALSHILDRHKEVRG